MINRILLRPEYSISRIIKGGWHLAGGHGNIDERQALEDMRSFVDMGITTFDCADIYTGVEELIGKFVRQSRSIKGSLPEIEIHTKYVPDYHSLASLTKVDTERIIDRSLMRLGVERLDLVQFAWWNYDIPGHVDVCLHLQELKQKGKIRYLGVTNYDAMHLEELLEAGLEIVCNQVQYSLLDHRPESNLIPLCRNNNILLLCYGVLAGGFLSDRYLGAPDPPQPLENRSLTKYRLIIDEFGGYDHFQKLLMGLQDIANIHQVGIAEIAISYILEKKGVAAAIIGARNDHHLEKLMQIARIQLTDLDLQQIEQLVSHATGPRGPVYDLERDKEGRHGRIMKYNLNAST